MRVNIKSLAAEARIIRQEVARTSDKETRASLIAHRRESLRREARAAQLLYAYVRGVPYRKLESKTRTDTYQLGRLIDSIKKKARKHCVAYDQRFEKQFCEWMR